jgi:hypothetical protein
MNEMCENVQANHSMYQEDIAPKFHIRYCRSVAERSPLRLVVDIEMNKSIPLVPLKHGRSLENKIRNCLCRRDTTWKIVL